nr:hypothetical protein [Amycolatopsis cihanbeyliensis]
MTCDFPAVDDLYWHLLLHRVADVGHAVGWQGDLQGRFVAGVVHLDGELGQVEQPIQQFLGGAVQVDREARQRVKQVDLVGAGSLRLAGFLLLQPGDRGEQGLPLLGPLPPGGVVHLVQVGEEQLPPLGSENPLDLGQNQVFPHADGGRVPGMLVRTTPVVVRRVAPVVGDAVARVADHPLATVTEHSPPEAVGAPRSRIVLPSREPLRMVLRALNSSNIHFGMSGSCAASTDHTHSSGGFGLFRPPRLRRARRL